MKALSGKASELVAASVEECYALIDAVEHYPEWHPERVREVTVLERDGEGRATRVAAKLHAAIGPLEHNFDLMMAVTRRAGQALTLTRIRYDELDDESFAVRWHLAPEGEQTRLTVELNARLDVPRLLPLGGVGDAVAEGFVRAAARTVLA